MQIRLRHFLLWMILASALFAGFAVLSNSGFLSILVGQQLEATLAFAGVTGLVASPFCLSTLLVFYLEYPRRPVTILMYLLTLICGVGLYVVGSWTCWLIQSVLILLTLLSIASFIEINQRKLGPHWSTAILSTVAPATVWIFFIDQYLGGYSHFFLTISC